MKQTRSRDLKNIFTQKYLEMRTAGASSEQLNKLSSNHSLYQGLTLGDVEGSEVPSGQVAGIIGESMSAGEIVRRIIEDSESILTRLQ